MESKPSLAVCVAVVSLALGVSAAARASTDVLGDVTTNTTWTAKGSPYRLTKDVAVAAGVTLTLQPGTVVQVAGDADGAGGSDDARVELTIHGHIVGGNVWDDEIVFESGHAVPQAGDWYGIVLASGVSGSSLIHAVVRHARVGFDVDGAPAGAMFFDGVQVSDFSEAGAWLHGASGLALRGLRFGASGTQSAGVCLELEAAPGTTHTGLSFEGCDTAVRLIGGQTTFSRCVVHGSRTNAFVVAQGAGAATPPRLTLSHCTLVANGQAVGAPVLDWTRDAVFGFAGSFESGAPTIELADSVSAGSALTFPKVQIPWTLEVSHSYLGDAAFALPSAAAFAPAMWRADPLLAAPAAGDFRPTTRSPLLYAAKDGTTIGAVEFDPSDAVTTPGVHGVYRQDAFWEGTVDVGGDVDIRPGVTLTIAPGSVLRFAQGDAAATGTDTGLSELRIQGALVAQGTEEAPILFESGFAPGTRRWSGILFDEGVGASSLSHIIVRHAALCVGATGRPLTIQDAEFDTCAGAIAVSGGSLELTRAHITGSDTAVSLTAAPATVSDVSIFQWGSARAFQLRAPDSDEAPSRFERVLVEGAGTAFELEPSDTVTFPVQIDHATLHGCTTAVLAKTSGAAAPIALDLTATVITETTGSVFDIWVPARIELSWHYTDIWGYAALFSGPPPTSLTATGTLSYNPLYVDAVLGDLHPTHRSPLRYSDGQGGAIGALPYEGAQTPGYAGFYWDDFRFEAGTHVVDGDIVVPSRRIPGSGPDAEDPSDDVPVTLTFAAGATLEMALGDLMAGGGGLGRVEIVVHGALALEGTAWSPVTLTAKAGLSNPQKGHWAGVIIASDAAPNPLHDLDVAFADTGVRVEGTAPLIERLRVHDCVGAGLHVLGSAPTLRDLSSHHNGAGLRLEGSSADLESVVTHHNTDAGLVIVHEVPGARDFDARRLLSYANGLDGVRVQGPGSGDLTLDLTRATLADNGANGLSCTAGKGTGSLAVDVVDSALTGNPVASLAVSPAAAGVAAVEVSVRHSDLWGGAGDTPPSAAAAADGVLAWNPLYAGPQAGNYAPTSRSPLRCAGIQGADIGYADFAGAATGALVGVLNADLTLTAAGSPYEVPGDLIVAGNCQAAPVTLTIEPGAVLRFAANADLMGGGDSSSLSELRVVDRLVVDAVAAPAQLVGSGAATGTGGDWGGVYLDAEAEAELRGFVISGASRGIWGHPTQPLWLGPGELRDGGEWGVSLWGKPAATLDRLSVRGFGTGGVRVRGEEPGAKVTVRDSSIRGVGVYGVWVEDADASLVGDVIEGAEYGFRGANRGSGLVAFQLANNTIHDQGHDGVFTSNDLSEGSVRLDAFNNLVTRCGGFAFHHDAGDGALLGAVDYNGFSETQDDGAGGSHLGLAKGAHSLSGDPGYRDLDPSGTQRWSDLRLRAGSPFIDAGTDALGALPDSDAAGGERVLPSECGAPGGVVDIGAYEYDPCANHAPEAVADGDTLVAMLDEVCFGGAGSTDVDPGDGASLDYAWTFDGGSPSSGASVCHVFTTPGVHEVVLTVADPQGGVAHAVLAVDVNHRPVADAGPPVLAVAGGAAASFDGTASFDPDGTIVSYAWDFGDGTPTASAALSSHPYAAAATDADLVATLTVTDDKGHSDSATTTVHVFGTDDDAGPLIVHTPVASPQLAESALGIEAQIWSPHSVSDATLHYRAAGEATETEIPLIDSGGGSFAAIIPAEAVLSPGVEYYLSARDDRTPPHQSTHPPDAPTTWHVVTVTGADEKGPSLTHFPPEAHQPKSKSLKLTVFCSDPSGVESVTLFTRPIGSSTWKTTPFEPGLTSWTATINASQVISPGVEYYIEARDLSPAANVGWWPQDGPGAPYVITVDAPSTVPPTLLHTPPKGPRPAGESTTLTVSASSASGIASVIAHYRIIGTSAWSTLTLGYVGPYYSAPIPASANQPPGVEYYLQVTDAASPPLMTQSPTSAPTVLHSFAVEYVEPTAPTVSVNAIPDGQVAGGSVTVWAFASASEGIVWAGLHHRRIGETSYTTTPMLPSLGIWYAKLWGVDLSQPGVEYYVSAIEGSALHKTGFAPADGEAAPYTFTVVAPPDLTPPGLLHDPVSGPVAFGVAVPVEVTAGDTSGIAAVSLFHRPAEGDGDFAEVPLALAGGGLWRGAIPAAGVVEAGVQYYIQATDASAEANQATHPPGAPQALHSFETLPDEVGPEIAHVPVDSGQEVGVPVSILATVTDFSGVAEVALHWAAAGGAWQWVPMTPADGSWVGVVPGEDVGLAGVDYYLEAVDASMGANESVLPEAAPTVTFHFDGHWTDDAGPSLSVSVADPPVAAGEAIVVHAHADDPSGVAGVTLHHRAAGGAYAAVPMQATSPGEWEGEVAASAVQAPSLELYVEAVDGSPGANVSVWPAGGADEPALLEVLGVEGPPDADADADADAAGGDADAASDAGAPDPAPEELGPEVTPIDDSASQSAEPVPDVAPADASAEVGAEADPAAPRTSPPDLTGADGQGAEGASAERAPEAASGAGCASGGTGSGLGWVSVLVLMLALRRRVAWAAPGRRQR
ncbi:MAG: PKD domain-containing protein [Deltaproteobacteria bacterium]|nr:PKD domain-containing protein [Deltaproteobacteria bacterium]